MDSKEKLPEYKHEKLAEDRLESLYRDWLKETNHGHYKDYVRRDFNLEYFYQESSSEQQIKAVLSNYKVPLVGRLLEVGCSSGRFLFHFSKNTSFDICVGIDLDRVALKMAKCYNEYQTITTKEILFKLASIDSIPFPDNYFDLIIFKDVGEHLGSYENFLSAIKELHRVLKVNGFIFMETPNYLFPLEVHLKIPMIPFVASKTITKIIAKLFKKDSSFIDHLFFITPNKANKAYSKYFRKIKSVYVEYKINKILNEPNLLSARYKFLLPVIKLLKVMKLSWIFKKILKLTGLHPELWYIVNKTN